MGESQAIIVTGAAGGLGGRTVERLSSLGHRVLAVDLDADRVDDTVRAGDGEVVAHAADVSESHGVAGAVEAARTRFGRLDAIFNNAAVEGPLRPIAEYSDDEFDRVMRINTRSVFLGMKHALPLFVEQGSGTILNTASTGGLVGWPGLSGYVASKHAVVGMTKAVALESATAGVRCNALCPGPMDTRMIWALGESVAPGDRAEQERQFQATVPLGRLGEPADVARFAAWLLTECPGYLTGAILPIDGAQTAG